MKNLLFVSALATFAATSAPAQTIVFGAGYADFSEEQSVDQVIFSLEYQHRPFHEATRFSTTVAD